MDREEARMRCGPAMGRKVFKEIFEKYQVDNKITEEQYSKFLEPLAQKARDKLKQCSETMTREQAKRCCGSTMDEKKFNDQFDQLQDFDMKISKKQCLSLTRQRNVSSDSFGSNKAIPEEKLVEDTTILELEQLKREHAERPKQIDGFALGYNPRDVDLNKNYTVHGASDDDDSNMVWNDTIYEEGSQRKVNETNIKWIERLIQLNKSSCPFTSFNTDTMRQFVNNLGLSTELDEYIENNKPPIVYIDPEDGQDAIDKFLHQVLNLQLRL